MKPLHAHLYEFNRSKLIPTRLLPPSKELLFIQGTRQIIQANFSNSQFDVATLARKVHLSVSQLNRKLNSLIDRPAGQLIWEMKMDYAAELLMQQRYTIAQVGWEIGFENQAHFCRSFKRKFQCTPTQFQKTNARRTHAQKR